MNKTVKELQEAPYVLYQTEDEIKSLLDLTGVDNSYQWYIGKQEDGDITEIYGLYSLALDSVAVSLHDSKLMEEGYYVNFIELPDGKLRMLLNREHEKDFRENVYDVASERGVDYAFAELIDDYLKDGWMIYQNEELGALTDALVFGNDYSYLCEDGLESDELTKVGRVYYNANYVTRNEITELLDKGFFDFTYHD